MKALARLRDSFRASPEYDLWTSLKYPLAFIGVPVIIALALWLAASGFWDMLGDLLR